MSIWPNADVAIADRMGNSGGIAASATASAAHATERAAVPSTSAKRCSLIRLTEGSVHWHSAVGSSTPIDASICR